MTTKAAIGIDIGGTTIDAVVVGRSKKVLWHEQVDTESELGYEAVLVKLTGLIERARSRADIIGVGLGVPGPVDPISGQVSEVVNLGWTSVSLKRDLKKVTGLEALFMNDASAAAYGEHVAGALRGVDRGVLITLGTGVGGGVIVNGKLYEGQNGLAMEIGHMTISDQGLYRCACGRNGCFETLTSATALVADAHNRLTVQGSSGWLDARVPFDAKIIMDGAESGDPFCEGVVHDWIQRLAIGVHNLRMLYDPEVIVFSGGLSGAGSYWLPRLEDVFLHQANFKSMPRPKLMTAQLGALAGSCGAGFKAFGQFGKEAKLER
ncbi:ROK family protein [Acidaminobacter hydrogenoformans]|uniref:Glucokinase n=1 Tax=Acidaminobacter hydrogenoformans DSM 2784 TaxID=1120920 RepID=A0A1G5RUC8_9FIRM|nr:ROK family protein [Acidaminobacter hydrogenoformans]SCZ77693.1 glucokinase [Acidaminobacter hydrogenoformans DSM 2784]